MLWRDKCIFQCLVSISNCKSNDWNYVIGNQKWMTVMFAVYFSFTCWYSTVCDTTVCHTGIYILSLNLLIFLWFVCINIILCQLVSHTTQDYNVRFNFPGAKTGPFHLQIWMAKILLRKFKLFLLFRYDTWYFGGFVYGKFVVEWKECGQRQFLWLTILF